MFFKSKVRRSAAAVLFRLEGRKPPRAVIQSLEFSFLDTTVRSFEIRESYESVPRRADSARPRDVRMPARDFSTPQSTLSLSIYELHELRTALQHR